MVAYKNHGPVGFDTHWGYPFDRGTLARTQSPWPGILSELKEAQKLLLEFKKTMTGHESRIAAVLRSDSANRVDFTIGESAVNKTLMDEVANAIEKGTVKIKLGSSGGGFRASYTSWKGRRPSPETTGRTGELTVNVGALPTMQGQVDVFHESVHALKDIQNYRIDRHQDEALAFLADTVFWLSLNKDLPAHQQTSFPTSGEAAPIYQASNALVKAKDMLDKPGAILKWSECDGLVKAIRQVRGYK
ncbi:MAG: hypothetical protein HKN70_11830 [Gammaproteobacteria bacterium]|nr:hypothetical protein [Gammaproteobacteria bacterium]